MTRIAIDLPSGLSSVDTSYSTQGLYRSADKVRFRQGRAEVIGGWEAISTSLLRGVCRNVLPAKDDLGAQMIFLGTHSNLYGWRAGALVDITPIDYVAGNIDGATGPGIGIGAFGKGPFGQFVGQGSYWPVTWSLSMYGQSLIASPRGGSIYWWQNDTTLDAELLSDFGDEDNTIPQSNTFTLVTAERAIMSLGCTQTFDENGDTPGPFNPRCIRNSDIGDGGLINWTPGNGTNAYEYELATGGALVAGALWADVIAIWTQDQLWQGQFIGAVGQPYEYTPVEGSVGLLGPNAQVVVGSTAYWVSQDCQIWACVAGNAPLKLVCPILNDTLDNITPAQTDKVVMSFCTIANEIRVDYPDVRDGTNENSRYLTLYLQDGTSWSQGIMDRTAYNRGAPLPYTIGVGAPILDTFGNLASKFYFHETGQTADGGPISWSIETNDFAMDEDFTAMLIQSLYPDAIEQIGPYDVTIFARDTPQSVERQYGPYTVAPGQTRIDLRIVTKLARILFSGNNLPAGLRIGRPVFDILPAGTRP